MVEISLSNFSKKAKGQLISLFLLIILALALALSLFFYNKNIINQLDNQQPKWQQQAQFQQHRTAIKQLITQINVTNSATQYIPLYQQLLLHFKAIAKLESNNENTFKSLLYEHNKKLPEVERLANNALRNQKYQQEALVLLNGVKLNVEELIDKKNQRIKSLYQQIESDQLIDKVTKTRLKAYAQLSQQLIDLITFKEKLQQLYTQSKSLSLAATLEDVNQLSMLANQLFFLNNKAPANLQAISTVITSSAWQKLTDIFVGDINLLAKWRGQSRLIENYHQQLQQWLDDINKPIKFQEAKKIENIFSRLIEFIQQYFPQFTNTHFIYSVFTLLILFVVIILSKLLALQRYVIKQHNQFVKLIDDAIKVNNNVVNEQENTSALTLNEKINIIKTHEQVYQQQSAKLSSLQATLALFAHHAKACYWQLPFNSLCDEQVVQIKRLLNDTKEATEDSFSSLWRQLFSTADCLCLIKQAKAAKRTKNIQTCTLKTKQGVAIEIIISYQAAEHLYTGLIINKSEFIEQAEKLSQLQRQFSHYQYQSITFTQQQQQRVISLVEQLFTELSLGSLHHEMSLSTANHLLTTIGDFLCQQKAVILLLANQYQAIKPQITERLRLRSTHLEQTLLGISSALRQRHIFKQNRVNIIVHQNILPLVTIDSEVFKQFFLNFSELFLDNLQQQKLTISLKLHDKNSGQQIIKIRFKLLSKSPLLLQQLKNLIVDELDVSQATTRLLMCRALFERLGVKEFVIDEGDDELTLQCQVPIALSQDKQRKANITFKQKKFVVIGENNIFIKPLVDLITMHHGFVVSVKNYQDFINGNIKQGFTPRVVAGVIVMDENEQIITRLMAALATQGNSQAKLAVLQSVYCDDYAKQGFYDLTYSPFMANIILKRLHKLFFSSQQSNQLISVQQCQQFLYQNTQVQVLLAVESLDLQMNFTRVLNYLGLQVTIVTNSDAMLTYWKTAKYLVLITEFNVSPFIKFNAKNNLPRGVYSINFAFEVAHNNGLDIAQHWHVKQIHQPYQLAELTQVLSQWLKRKTTIESSIEASNSNVINAVVDEANTLVDFQQYNKNQGSVEIAALMFDHYIMQIQAEFKQLSRLLQSTNTENNHIIELVNSLLRYCKIIAAPSLIEILLQLAQEINVNKSVIKANKLLVQLEQQIILLTKLNFNS